jgi:S-adenosylmethionine:tRNA ribosyltransferase-isomerase
MSTRTADYDYTLPPELIARYPAERREGSRMMVLHPDSQRIEHRMFAEFPQFIGAGDLVVLNDTRVIPARVFSDDRRVEMLLLEQTAANTWQAMVKPGRRARKGVKLTVGGVAGEVLDVLEGGERVIRFAQELDLEHIGSVPLPPYLERDAEALDKERYQTVFAREPGAVAAPTAGLHFTPDILEKIPHAFVTLHVGPGTFRPVQVEDVSGHRMHAERYEVSPLAADVINGAQRIVAVGTTTVRVLESHAGADGRIAPGAASTDIFIRPPHEFRVADALLTNFHLPKSTLLMLVSAFAGREFVLRAYDEAVREDYRFYSYGDCMLIICGPRLLC